VRHFIFVLLFSHILFAQPNPVEEHKKLLIKADVSVAQAAIKTQQDPLRPIYHLTTAANWINDPNGPIYFNGEYHMFYQHNPYGDKWGNMSWAHAKSKDLAHWQRLPIALTPNPDSYDKDGVYSGCCVIDDNGIPTIIYTGTQPETQCIARSYDGMKTWVKFEGNPVIANPPVEKTTGFRDPFVWKQGDEWLMALGSGILGQGGAAFLYRSKNLEEWEYVHPMATGFGDMWECPNFFPLGNKWVLAVSPFGEVKYTIGEFKDLKFQQTTWERMDLGGRAGFYAPNCLLAPDGRRIMWGWITKGGNEGYPWNGMLTIPRVLSLRKDGRLGMGPAEEIKALRGRFVEHKNIVLENEKPFLIPDFKSNTFEMKAEFELQNSRGVGIKLLRSPDGKEETDIHFDTTNLILACGDKQGYFQLLPGEDKLALHIFVDRSVIEIYANGRECLTVRTFPKEKDSLGIQVYTKRRAAKVDINLWEMKSMWE
jgi:beta-fructofuranosidase